MSNDRLDERCAREYAPGTTLFRQGERGNHMYVIRSGKVEIIRNVGGRETAVAVLPPGEFFGEMSLINNEPRSATARVVARAELLVIGAGAFETMIRQSSEIAVRLIKKLAVRLAEADRQIELLMLRDPSSRVVQCLRQEAETAGSEHAAGIAVGLTRELLAERLGLSLEDVSAVVGKLERARLLKSRNDGTFVVAEVGRLQDFIDFLEMKERYGKPGTR